MNLSTTSSSLNHLSFNQDFGCFALATTKGFQIFNSDPLKLKLTKEFDDGGIGLIEMLFRTNFVGLVGGGRNPKFSGNKVIIWDDLKGKEVFELEFKSKVKGLKLSRDRIVVALNDKVFVYSFGSIPQKLYTFDTALNQNGLLSLSSSPTSSILCLPSPSLGHLQLIDLNPCPLLEPNQSSYNSATSSLQSSQLFDPLPIPKIKVINAHSSKLACFTLNQQGTLVASASEKGTLIRIFDTSTGKVINELRRGVDRAEIYSMSFNEESTRLCVSSDKGTIHIFNLNLGVEQGATPSPPLSSGQNRSSSLKFMKDILPKYFNSQWSFASYQLPTPAKAICGFSPNGGDNAILVLCSDGSYFRLLYDSRNGGTCSRDLFKRFYKI